MCGLMHVGGGARQCKDIGGGAISLLSSGKRTEPLLQHADIIYTACNACVVEVHVLEHYFSHLKRTWLFGRMRWITREGETYHFGGAKSGGVTDCPSWSFADN